MKAKPGGDVFWHAGSLGARNCLISSSEVPRARKILRLKQTVLEGLLADRGAEGDCQEKDDQTDAGRPSRRETGPPETQSAPRGDTGLEVYST